MGDVVFLALRETSPGRYEGNWSVPEDQGQGTYSVVGFVHIDGVDRAVGAACAFQIGPPRVASTIPLPPSVGVPTGTLPPAPQTTHPSGPAPATGLSDLPGWADQVANILAYVIVFYGMVAGAAAANFKGGWIMAVAMMAIVWFLRDLIITPLQQLAKQILLVLFHVIFEIVDFLLQWLRGIGSYFGGDVVQAIIRILTVASFMWVWEWAQQIPVVQQTTQWILDTAGKIIGWVNDGIDALLRVIYGLRDQVDGWVASFLHRLGATAEQLTTDITGYVDRLFGGLTQQVQTLREEVLSRVDFVTQFTHLQVRVLGHTVYLMPETVRRHLMDVVLSAAQRESSAGRGLVRRLNETPHPAPARTVGPWEVVDHYNRERSARAGGYVPLQHQLLDEAVAHFRQLREGDTPAAMAWPDSLDYEEDAALEPADLPAEITESPA